MLTDFLGDNPLNRDSILNFFNHLQDKGLSEWTRRGGEKTIKSFGKWLFEEGTTKTNLAANIERTKIHSKIKTLPSQQEVLDLIDQATEPSPHESRLGKFSKMEHRDCLRFMVVACGGRNYETSQIRKKDVSISALEVVMVEGKGGSRIQAIPSIPWLIKDLKRRVEGLRTKGELQVLSDKTHYKESDKDRVFVVNAFRLRKTMKKAAKIYGKPLLVHDLRRIFAIDMKNNGADIDEIRDVMGHKNIETTRHYLEHNSATQTKILNHFSSETRKYRSKEKKASELISHAWSIGQIVKGGSLKGKILKLEIEIT